jgi:hypothetical protein
MEPALNEPVIRRIELRRRDAVFERPQNWGSSFVRMDPRLDLATP